MKEKLTLIFILIFIILKIEASLLIQRFGHSMLLVEGVSNDQWNGTQILTFGGYSFETARKERGKIIIPGFSNRVYRIDLGNGYLPKKKFKKNHRMKKYKI